MCTTSNQPDQPFRLLFSPTAFDEMVLQNKSMESKDDDGGRGGLDYGVNGWGGYFSVAKRLCRDWSRAFNFGGIVGTVAFIALGVVVSGDQPSVMKETSYGFEILWRGHSPVVISLPDMAMTTLGKTGSYHKR